MNDKTKKIDLDFDRETELDKDKETQQEKDYAHLNNKINKLDDRVSDLESTKAKQDVSSTARNRVRAFDKQNITHKY